MSKPNSTLLAITGATGFVGRHLLAAAVARGYQVRALVRNPDEFSAVAGVEATRWDLERDNEVDTLRDANAIIHAAAFVPQDYSDAGAAERCLRANALGTLKLLLAGAEVGVSEFIYLSFGNGYLDPSVSPREASALYPSRHAPYYLASKLAGEIYVDHFRRCDRLRTCILRPSSIYGPGMVPGLVPKLTSRLLAGQPITLQDGGRHTADLVYVGDVVSAALTALERRIAGILNVGSGESTSVRQMARVLLQLLGADPSLVVVEPPSNKPATGFPALDISEAVHRLDYNPTRLAVGLKRYVDWFSEAQ